jgi:hypothetical protein
MCLMPVTTKTSEAIEPRTFYYLTTALRNYRTNTLLRNFPV